MANRLVARRKPSTDLVLRPSLTVVQPVRRTPRPTDPPTRALTAAARPLDLTDRSEGKRLSMLRQAWQGEAWAYRRSLGELRYATSFLGNAAQRMRIYVATTIDGEVVPVEDAPGIPQEVVDACRMALAVLGTGPTGIAPLLKLITENFEVAGECFLVGSDDPITGATVWKIRSTSETVTDPSGKIGFRDLPGAAGGSGSSDPAAIVWADPANTFVARLWWPDPEFSNLADSPFKAILDVLEELLLLGRDVRATARSRLANNGILAIPSELTVVVNHATARDDEAPTFGDELMATAMSALTDEGSAAAVVPILVQGKAEFLDKIKHIEIKRENNKEGIAQRGELIDRIAIGIDLPPEVLTGKGEANHWSAWAISDDTFRDHIEPIVIAIVDALTQGYLWPVIEAGGVDPAMTPNLFLWYDPTELVTKPDRTKDAMDAYDRHALSWESLRKHAGFTEDDMPSAEEMLIRMVMNVRAFDPAIQSEILRRLDPTIVPIEPKSGVAPVAPGAPAEPSPVAPPAEGPPATGDGGGPPPPAAPGASMAHIWERLAAKQAALVAAAPAGATVPLDPVPSVPGDDRAKRVQAANRQLVDIDRRLRDRLIVAANAAVKQALSRAGAKIVSKSRTASGADIRAAIQDVPVWRVPFAVGPAIRAAAGLDERAIIDTSLADLRTQWDLWVSSGQQQALRAAARIGGLDVNTAYGMVEGKFKDNADAGWNVLEKSLRDRTVEILRTAPLDDITATIEVDAADNLVSAGLVRSALAVAGGFGQGDTSSGLGSDGTPVDGAEPMGQIGTGDTIEEVLTDAGAEIQGYEWVHGPSANPFEPHEALDGVVFADFADGALGVPEGVNWGGDYWAPGDHAGCLCDFMPVWTTPDEAVSPDAG